MSYTAKNIGKRSVTRAFAKLKKKDKEVKSLNKFLGKQRFRARTKPKNFFGMRTTFIEKKEKAIVSLQLQDYGKAGV